MRSRPPLRRHRPTEIETHNGFLLQFARRKALTLATHERVLAWIRGMEHGHRSPDPTAAAAILAPSAEGGSTAAG